MQFNVLTMYPDLIQDYIKQSYLQKAIKSGELVIKIINQRLSDKNLSNIYDAPFGGGPGIIMRVDNFYKNMKPYLKNSYTILFSPKGQKLTQKKLYQISNLGNVNLICCRFEGYDKRIEKYCDEILSIGDYVISGSELAALIVIEGTYRLYGKQIKEESIINDSYGKDGSSNYLEEDQYTRPRLFKSDKVPQILFSGNHQKIKEWNKSNKKIKN